MKTIHLSILISAFSAVVCTAGTGAGEESGSLPGNIQPELVLIPGGEFTMGEKVNRKNNYVDNAAHMVWIDSFYIDKYEVTNGQYLEFCRSTGHPLPEFWGMDVFCSGPGFPDHPVVGVTYYEAEAYCKWAGGRLPTEAEWEKAARWDQENQRAYAWPWGDTWDPEKCNNPEDHNPAGGGYRTNQSAAVGSYPAGASPYGCMDMVGNAYEWVADCAKSYPGSPEPFAHNGYHFVRGGCWDDGPLNVRCAYRGWYLPPGSGGVEARDIGSTNEAVTSTTSSVSFF